MHYVGVAIDASNRKVRICVIDGDAIGDPPDFRPLSYGEGDELPTALRDLHTATVNMLGEVPTQAFAVRRQETFDRGALRNATIDRLAAEGAILAAARDAITDVRHLTGDDAAGLLGVTHDQAIEDARTLLTGYGKQLYWKDALIVARSLL
jgi:hypothetical protein